MGSGGGKAATATGGDGFFRRFTNPNPELTFLLQSRARLLAGATLIIGVAATLVIVLRTMTDGIPPARNPVFYASAATVLASALIYPLSRGRHYSLVALLSMIILSTAFFVAVFATERPEHILIVATFPVILTALLLKARDVIVMSVVTLAAVWFLDAPTTADHIVDVILVAAPAGEHAKTSLIATVNHELRTPLNSIIGFAQLLATGAVVI